MTEIGLAYIEMVINCNEIAAKLADGGDFYEDIKCIAKAVKPECATCSLVNPNTFSPYLTNSHEDG
jgi:hypothetical protein